MNNHQYLKNGNKSPQGETQSRLISLLNAAGSALEGARPFAQSQASANYTDADVKFLEAAREVVSLHQYQIDPTIRDILNRLQYANSPHGGLPFSREYMDKLNDDDDEDDEDDDNDDEEAEQADHENTPSNSGDHRYAADDAYLHGNSGGNGGSDEFPQLSLDIFKTDDLFHNNSTSDNTSAARTTLLSAGIAGLSGAAGSNSRSFSQNNNSPHIVHAPEDMESPSTFFHNQVSQYEREQRDSIYASEPPATSKSRISADGVPRNYLCKTCGLSFKRSSDLKRHEKIHLEVPPNVCPNCKKGFARKDALKRHINTLTCKRNRERLLKSMKNAT